MQWETMEAMTTAARVHGRAVDRRERKKAREDGQVCIACKERTGKPLLPCNYSTITLRLTLRSTSTTQPNCAIANPAQATPCVDSASCAVPRAARSIWKPLTSYKILSCFRVLSEGLSAPLIRRPRDLAARSARCTFIEPVAPGCRLTIHARPQRS